ncbi:hypothetical protein BO99DRAFT_415460 [Aspergillus violaceofuscus CBS 115571]|uniref:Uncharacterized protein n=1 Tax=Aspergillus violaceofuscus (strain CBS 115571) TaxID=1450538 RepID=A0A2V5H2C2_ASPV1|nr:hypothetical protein BO99DRAFT_415460 [Aspergillus violaceofuscus CBS 115571]
MDGSIDAIELAIQTAREAVQFAMEAVMIVGTVSRDARSSKGKITEIATSTIGDPAEIVQGYARRSVAAVGPELAISITGKAAKIQGEVNDDMASGVACQDNQQSPTRDDDSQASSRGDVRGGQGIKKLVLGLTRRALRASDVFKFQSREQPLRGLLRKS